MTTYSISLSSLISGGSLAALTLLQKYGAGLYLEANGALFSGDENSSYGYPESSDPKRAGLGIAIGGST